MRPNSIINILQPISELVYDIGCEIQTKQGKHAIEFFSGTALVTKCAQKLGYHCTSVDYDIRLNPDYCTNILNFDYSLFPYQT